MTGYENDNQTVLLTAFAKALSIGIKDPRLQILVTNVENLTAYIYSEFAYEPAQFNIRRFNQLTEQDLSNLGNLTGLMKKRVGELNTLKEKLASVTQFAQYSDCAKKKSGEPCDAAKSCIKPQS